MFDNENITVEKSLSGSAPAPASSHTGLLLFKWKQRQRLILHFTGVLICWNPTFQLTSERIFILNIVRQSVLAFLSPPDRNFHSLILSAKRSLSSREPVCQLMVVRRSQPFVGNPDIFKQEQRNFQGSITQVTGRKGFKDSQQFTNTPNSQDSFGFYL